MAEFVIERCLPSDRATEIKDLFTRVGMSEFSPVFDHVYRAREHSGLRSWIALDGGRAVHHVSVNPERFTDGERALTGGVLADLMADQEHRDFWGPIKLMRRMVADVRRDQLADFLLTSFAPAAEGVFKAAGFKQFAVLRRHFMPLLWPYPLIRRLQHGERVPRLTAVPFADVDVEVAFRELTSPGCFRPVVSTEYFATRMPRAAFPAGWWLHAGPPNAPDAAVLVSPQPGRDLVVADVLWRNADASLTGLLSAVAKWATRSRFKRVTLTSIEGSPLARAAQRAGFLTREPYRLMSLSINPRDSFPSSDQWSFTPFMVTAW